MPLDHEFDGTGAPVADDGGGSEPSSPIAGCEILPGSGATSLAGDARSLPLGDGGVLWVVDQATEGDGGVVVGAGFVSHDADGACTVGEATPIGSVLDVSPLEPDGFVAPLDLVDTAAGQALYYELFARDPTEPYGLRNMGIGLAPRDPGRGVFVPTAELLWSADRPAYGSSAFNAGSVLYVWGCKGSGYLSSDCFVAKSSPTDASSSAAYSYWAGDHWSPSADDAAPIASAGSIVSVRPDATRLGRWLMTYVPPVGSTLVARSAVAPEGPWSEPVTLGACTIAQAGPGAFCSGAQQHPALGSGAQSLVLTYDARSFAADGGAVDAFWPQLVRLQVPASLP